jgi:prepilin-type N-terminal cleavage/methylation domain-containing protein
MKTHGKNRDELEARRRTATQRRARAFTLIEVMMVVAIIGLTLMMGLPAFLRVIHRQGMAKAE